MSMSRIECESALLRKMKEILDIYHEYNPEGDYLTLDIVHNTHINANNCEYTNDKAISCHMRVEEDENIACSFVYDEDKSLNHIIHFDIRDASLTTE